MIEIFDHDPFHGGKLHTTGYSNISLLSSNLSSIDSFPNDDKEDAGVSCRISRLPWVGSFTSVFTCSISAKMQADIARLVTARLKPRRKVSATSSGSRNRAAMAQTLANAWQESEEQPARGDAQSYCIVFLRKLEFIRGWQVFFDALTR